MVRDDLQACLQAYQFAELLLAGSREKSEKDRQEAVEAARRLSDEVQTRYEAATGSGCYSAQAVESLKAVRARLAQKVSDST